jgi:hypothetical protein
MSEDSKIIKKLCINAQADVQLHRPAQRGLMPLM